MKPGAREFLTELSRRGIPMAAATSSDKEQIKAAFERLGIRQFFRGIATCGEAGEGKNSPAVYDMARKMLSCQREECVVLEDSLFALQTAKAAGSTHLVSLTGSAQGTRRPCGSRRRSIS